MNPGLIVLIVFLSLLALFIAVCVMDMVFVFSFRRLFRVHLKAMVVFLNMKYDNIKKLMDVMKTNGVQIDNSLICQIQDIHREDFDDIEGKGCKKSQEILTYIKDELLYIARGLKDLHKHSEFKTAVENVSSLENQYRNTIASYNADVLGYNYWISFWPSKWIWKLFKFQKKSLIMN